jgi:hypothetical protein
MKKFLFLSAVALTAIAGRAQIGFDPTIDTAWMPSKVVLPASPLKTQVLFIGGYHKVQTPMTYGNAQGQALAKQWHDFIGFTPDNGGSGDLGWVSVNHERVVSNDSIGDGGGMTVFKVRRDANTDTLIIVNQTLTDGRSGEFFAVDFAHTTGETGMNCGGITSQDGRIWTAEEWWRGDNSSIADRDTSDFIIGTGTVNGQSANAGFPGFNGDTIKKYQNYNYMVEINPKEAKALRKQYNWGRQAFEGGTVMPDNKTVYLGVDATPGFITKFVATTAGDFTQGTTYVYKHDATSSKWIIIDNTDLDKMLNYQVEAVAAGATMFNRLEWVTNQNGKVYFTETGRSNPGGRWRDEHVSGAVHAPHHLARATTQTTHPDSSNYVDYYGRILVLDPANDNVSVLLEGGPDFATSPTPANYPAIHLSNPDGLNSFSVNGRDYLIICEDLNQTDFGSVPAGIANRTCEMYLLDMSIANPTVNDLVRIGIVPVGAEITGAVATPDGKTILVNSQHPSSSNPFPFNNSLTMAITGWDKNNIGIEEYSLGNNFNVYPNPTTRFLNFNKMTDVAIYDNNGQRIRVYRETQSIDVSDLKSGVYYLKNTLGDAAKFLVK